MRGDGDVPEEAEAHGPVAQGMVSRGSDSAEGAGRAPVQRHVDGVEDAPQPRRRRVPGALAGNGVRVEASAP